MQYGIFFLITTSIKILVCINSYDFIESVAYRYNYALQLKQHTCYITHFLNVRAYLKYEHITIGLLTG